MENAQGRTFVPEPQVFGGHEPGEEDVDALANPEGHCDDAVRAWFAVQAADVIRQVVQHRQVVLHDDDVLLHVDQRPDHPRRFQALLHVEVGTGFVEHVAIRVLHCNHGDSEPLELPAGKRLHVPVQHVLQVELGNQLLHHVPVVPRLQRSQNDPLHRFRDVVHVLGFDQGFNVIFQQPGEVVLKLAASEVVDDFLPIGRRREPSEVGFHLARQDF